MMFNGTFYPTPPSIIARMVEGLNLQDKTILEPSAGSGKIVEYCQQQGATVLACENDKDLQKIISAKCLLIAEDFFDLTSEKISHINYIIMNPPFNYGAKHILHAYNIAPAGCKIISLCNWQTLDNAYSYSRNELKQLIDDYGSAENLGDCFADADRKTGAEIGLLILNKPGGNYQQEFEGFFMEDEPEQAEGQQSGLMSYNAIRDLVHRYISAVKIFDEQLNTAVKLNETVGSFFSEKVGFQCTKESYQTNRGQFKKDLQKSAWKYIFREMNMTKHTTRGLREDINKFIETQSEVPFTMKNIFRMLEIVIGTTSQRMDKALLEVFDKLTKHYDENRYNVEGWKTNAHYLVNKRFIFPYGAEINFSGKVCFRHWRDAGETLIDFEKALCYISGNNYDTIKGCFHLPNDMEPGQWHDTHFFRVRCYKKGTTHCEFKDEELWARFNQHIAKLKGYPLFESTGKKPTYGQPKQKPQAQKATRKAAVLFEMEL